MADEPILLSDSATIAASSSGRVNALALKNPLNQPIEIHHITWKALSTAGTPRGADIRCALTLNKHEVTQGTVPLTLMSRTTRRRVWQTGAVEAMDFTPELAAKSGVYTWKLPCPLLIEAGETLMPGFENQHATEDVAVTIAYSGRVLDRASRGARIIPWVAGYTTKSFAVYTNAEDTDVAPETTFYNAYTTPITVQKLVGYTTATDMIFAAALLELRLASSVGQEDIVRDWTRFAMLFGGVRRELPLAHVLPAGGYYSASFRKVATDIADYAVPAQAQLGVIGCREVRR